MNQIFERKIKCRTQKLKKGQTVTVTIAWKEDETPTAKNFVTGKVLEVIERSKYAFYVRVEGLKNIVPADRVKLTA